MSISTKKKTNLFLNVEEENTGINTNDTNATNNINNENNVSQIYNNINFTQSIEFGLESVIFKNDNISVGLRGIKQLNTGEFVSVVDPNDFQIGDFVGSGASGTVHLALFKPNGVKLVIKSINIYDKEKRKQFKNDLKVLSENNCPYLVRFYGAFFDDGNVKLILEYMNLGSLDKVITKIKNFPQPCCPEIILSKITDKMLNGLFYLHKIKHKIHRDIKPANVLINSDGIVKLTDFGIARTLENTTDLSNTFVGTKSYMSPERILGEVYSYSSDIWSLGLIVYEMATGQFPYKFSKVYIEHVESILEDPEPTIPDNELYSPELRHFITRCLKKDPKQRASAAELCKHPWITKYHSEQSNISKWLDDVFNSMQLD